MRRRRFLGGALAGAGACSVPAPLRAADPSDRRALTPAEQLEILLADLPSAALKPGAARFGGVDTALDLPADLDAAIEKGATLAPDVASPETVASGDAGAALRAVARAALLTPDPDAWRVRWPADPLSVDHKQFVDEADVSAREQFNDTPFEIDAATLARAAGRNAFKLEAEVVLFAARGARLTLSPQDRTIVREATPSHWRAHCVIGVWRRSSGEVSAYAGATTPSAAALLAQRRLGRAADVAALIPTGLHRLRRGVHRPGGPAEDRDALLFDAPYAGIYGYDRDGDGYGVTATSRWNLRETPPPLAALHAAALDAAPFQSPGGRALHYSSAGGPTIAGAAEDGALRGDWGRFQQALIDTGASKAATLPFMMLTGRDLRLAWRDPTPHPAQRRWRFGSEGRAVTRLQRALGVAETGRFDHPTQIAYVTRQLKETGAADGVVTPARAAALLRLDL